MSLTPAIIPERYLRGLVRALVLSNMLPSEAHPERGRFVRDQVAALDKLGDVEVELYEFAPGPAALARAALDLRRRHGPPTTLSSRPAAARLDVVHAHFGLAAWPGLAVPANVRALTLHGTDISHPRTRLATAAVLPLIDLLAVVSSGLLSKLPSARARRTAQVLPCGVDVERFRAIPRAEARAQLGLDTQRPYLLFPADPARPEKRHDLALALAADVNVELLNLGGVDPDHVTLWINAANAVLVPSQREGFGLAVLEALACNVPVLATPVGIHPDALNDIAGTLCAPFDLRRWRTALRPHLALSEPRIDGRAAAQRFSAATMAARVRDAWQRELQRSGSRSG